STCRSWPYSLLDHLGTARPGASQHFLRQLGEVAGYRLGRATNYGCALCSAAAQRAVLRVVVYLLFHLVLDTAVLVHVIRNGFGVPDERRHHHVALRSEVARHLVVHLLTHLRG